MQLLPLLTVRKSQDGEQWHSDEERGYYARNCSLPLQAHYYENPILAYFTDCRIALPAERFNSDHPQHVVVKEEKMLPTEKVLDTYYSHFMQFMSTAR